MELKRDDLVNRLRQLKKTQGVEVYDAALKGLVRNLLLKDQGTDYILSMLSELGSQLDLEALRKEAMSSEAKASGPAVADEVMLETLKQEMPNLKTQAQFDLVMKSWDILRVYLNEAFVANTEIAQKARGGLNNLLDLALKVGSVAEVLNDHPEATTNSDFTNPPAQYTESSSVGDLLDELSQIKSKAALEEWYTGSKDRMDKIVTQGLRNKLFDAVREKASLL